MSKRYKILIPCGIALAILCSLGTLFFPLSKRADFNDSSIYQYIGYLITKGKVPYVDAFDHKGIYFYFLNALGYLINAKWGMWILIIACMSCCIVEIYRTASRFLSHKNSILLTIIIAGGLGTSFWDGDTPDFFAVLFSFIAFDQLSNFFINGELNNKDAAIIGLASGIAFWIKPNMILGTLVSCAYVIIFYLVHKNLRAVWKNILFFALAFIAASLPGVMWLIAKGAFHEMIQDYFLFNMNYVSFYATGATRLNALAKFLSLPTVYFLLGCLFIVLFMSLKKWAFDKTDTQLLFCGGLSFAVCLAHAAMTGNSYEQYAMLFYPSILFMLIAIWQVFERLPTRALKSITLILAAVILFMTGLKEYRYCKFFWNRVPQEQEILDYIQDNSNSDDTIAIASPYYSGYYIATGRDSATKYVYVQANHFVNAKDHPEAEEDFWESYTDALLRSKPRIILYDRQYESYDGVKLVLNGALKYYTPAGKSSQFEFYVLPRRQDENISG